MKSTNRLTRAIRALLAVAAASGAGGMVAANAQDAPAAEQRDASPTDAAAAATLAGAAAASAQAPLEEVIVVDRLQNAAKSVVRERIDQEVVADFLGSEQVSRAGDSSVSLALRRLPGVTLVNDQFIYIRGLGERYSSTTLNGAKVPSPDLTRNVVPLDLFPAAIIESLQVQKGYTPDRPAAFGGGNVDIRTRGLPDRPVFDIQVGTGWDSDSGDKALTYAGGEDDRFGSDDGTRALPRTIRDAIGEFQGDISPAGIFNALLRDGQAHTVAEAQAINRQLGASLQDDIDIEEKSVDPDFSFETAMGNTWSVGASELWRIGVLGIADYKNQWRNRDRTNRGVSDPGENFTTTRRTTNQVALTGALNVGVEFAGEHQVQAGGMYLRNTEDEASLSTGHNFNFQRESGQQLREYRLRYEERDLELLQVRGSHTLGAESRARLGDWTDFALARDLRFSWYYSDATARTEIPGELLVSAEDRIDAQSGEVLSTGVRSSATAADYRFTELMDQVTGFGWQLTKPFEMGRLALELSGGWDYYEKGRSYLQTQLGLGTTLGAAQPALSGTPGTVFADDNVLDPANGFVLSLGGIGTETYLAAETVDAAFGKFDLTWNERWRLAGGVRWEDFTQISVPLDQYEFDTETGKIPLSPDQLATLATVEDGYYPALALTHMKKDFWARDFQLRFGWSQTVARPDLREISAATFIDPLTEARVRGNPDLVTSDIANFDLRAEWFFENGDNFTVSAFYKEITDPIETIEGAGTDDNIALTFINADSAELYGVEFEWLKELDFLSGALGSWTDAFFVAGNLTLSDSEIVIGDAAINLTNDERRLSQQSEYVANFQLGFDSPGGAHSATLVYNAFGERLFFAGRNGAPDAFEEPFHSLDLIYTFYPAEAFSMKLRLQNLLGEKPEIQQGGVIVLEQGLGTTYKLDATMRF